MDICDETHLIRWLAGKNGCYAGCYAAGCHLPGSEEHLLIHQGRQLCDDKQAPSVLVNFKLIVRCF